ncbi:hypothetical protein PVL29_022122 [Vitis rotundifolia]|uniref:non-specific serine/threonine protein kinase n=1 Tax=Vitis rotundifolia TaxID=103349 RepID=A0AA38YUR2_VITRO|nr:hypothetical protein PVL29_022122 [Vitis rotundifolia]
MHPRFFPSTHFISILIFLLSHHFPISIRCEDSPHVECNVPVQCDDEVGKIEYPFWVDGYQPDCCGHPAFKLDCTEFKPTIEIMYRKYDVININYEAQILTIAGVNRFFFKDICCPEPNTTMDSTLFKYTSNTQNATLFYNCPPGFQHPATTDVFCLKYGAPEHAFFVVNTSLATELVSTCGAGVVVPVLATAAQGFMNHSLIDFYQVLNEGFEVKWTVEEGQCGGCAESGGRCGYNLSFGQPSCYCPDKPYSTSCPTLKAPPPIAPTPTALNSPKSSTHPFSSLDIFLFAFFLHCFFY